MDERDEMAVGSILFELRLSIESDDPEMEKARKELAEKIYDRLKERGLIK